MSSASLLEWIEKQVHHSVFISAKTRNRLVNIPKYPKRALLMIADFCLFSFALWISLSLRFSGFYTPPHWEMFYILLLAPVIGVFTLFFLNIYKTVTRFIDSTEVVRLNFAVVVASLIWGIGVYLNNHYGVLPRSTVFSYMVFSMFLLGVFRWFVRTLLRSDDTPKMGRRIRKLSKKILVYGAGVTGTQLVETLSRQGNFDIIAFVDDNPALWSRRIAGYRIYAPDYLAKIIEKEEINEIILALPSASIAERKRIVRFLEPYPIAVRTLPAIEDIVSGDIAVQDLKYIDVEDLLGRDPVPPIENLADLAILGKSVMVTGAGGSIGSELCRQVLKSKPSCLVLFELSEAALYVIEQELFSQQAELEAKAKRRGETEGYSLKIIALLGSVQDQDRMTEIIQNHKIATIFHAAAYKHVPLVEANPLIGIRNNLWGTKTVADTALACGVERFVLISTDKAVRPTNVMGASKRLAEMYLQALSDSHREKEKTIFTMVRFGNVLDSSGSVVQTFRKQIAQGGPVTITHLDIVRYFMSIPEAAGLVIQAGAMAEGGEVYILDMGDPVKIIDLASTMIRLMGFEVRSKGNPDGDIALSVIGLRPGEKLYEELLIDENSVTTVHPRIRKNKEDFLQMEVFLTELEHLDVAIKNGQIEIIYQILEKLVSGYNRNQKTPEKLQVR